MADGPFARVKYLAFDIFGTVMDLKGSLAESCWGPSWRRMARRCLARRSTRTGGTGSASSSTRTTC